MRQGTTLLSTVAAGAATAFFFDPVSGTRRRQRLADAMIHAANATSDAAGKIGHDLRNRTRGIGRRPSSQIDILRRDWAPATRAMVGASGAVLVAVGLSRRSRGGIGLATAGAALLARAMTNLEFDRLLGMNLRRGVDVQKTLTID